MIPAFKVNILLVYMIYRWMNVQKIRHPHCHQIPCWAITLSWHVQAPHLQPICSLKTSELANCGMVEHVITCRSDNMRWSIPTATSIGSHGFSWMVVALAGNPDGIVKYSVPSLPGDRWGASSYATNPWNVWTCLKFEIPMLGRSHWPRHLSITLLLLGVHKC